MSETEVKEVKNEAEMKRILIFQVCTPNESMVMLLRDDYKMEMGVNKREVVQ